MSRLEMWVAGPSIPRWALNAAAEYEADGWDGFGLADSQCLWGDPYAVLGAVARATSTIGLSTAVTNPVTRHPAVTAGAIATLQAESHGRATLGIGRGDSALAYLGLAPAPLKQFERYLEQVQTYLSGGSVALHAAASWSPGGVASVDSLELAGGPAESRLRWLSPQDRKVPVEVAASGPRVIQMAARLADRIVFAVGADLARLEWAIGLARQAVRGSGRDPQSLGLGAFICVIPHADMRRARRLASGTLASLSRFSVMYGAPRGPVSERDQTVLRQIHDTYDIGMHFTDGSPQSHALDDQFIDRHAIVGSPERCAGRIRELASLGLDRFYVLGPSSGIDPDARADWRRTFADQVLPRLR